MVWRGFGSILPLWTAAIPAGMAYVAAAGQAGMAPAEILSFSLLVYAGTSQFAAVQLLAAGSSGLTILLTVLVINARFLLLGAALAPHLRPLSLLRRVGLASLLVEETFAVAAERVSASPEGGARFLLGANLSLYAAWFAGNVAGLLLARNSLLPQIAGLQMLPVLVLTALAAGSLGSAQARTAAAVAAVAAAAGQAAAPGAWVAPTAAVIGSLTAVLAGSLPGRPALRWPAAGKEEGRP